MGIISIENLTKDYGKGRGVFDVSLQVEKGEIYGYLGPNGAGKSTTMRHLMGFSKADKGDIRILGMDCWREQKKIQEKVGYLPGEIAFFSCFILLLRSEVTLWEGSDIPLSLQIDKFRKSALPSDFHSSDRSVSVFCDDNLANIRLFRIFVIYLIPV